MEQTTVKQSTKMHLALSLTGNTTEKVTATSTTLSSKIHLALDGNTKTNSVIVLNLMQ